MFERILNLIFPPRCIFCENIINFDTKLYVCDSCIKKLPYKDDKYPLVQEIDGFYFESIICIFAYDDKVKEAIKRFKFNDRTDYGMKFARIIQNSTKNVTSFKIFDIIISVPMHKARLKSRGYNQSYLVSSYLSKYYNIDEMSNILTKIVNTKSQTTLSRKERFDNLKNAFMLNDVYLIKKKNILLIDDVFTTGSTVNECSRVLIDNGASSVTVLVIASNYNFLY